MRIEQMKELCDRLEHPMGSDKARIEAIRRSLVSDEDHRRFIRARGFLQERNDHYGSERTDGPYTPILHVRQQRLELRLFHAVYGFIAPEIDPDVEKVSGEAILHATAIDVALRAHEDHGGRPDDACDIKIDTTWFRFDAFRHFIDEVANVVWHKMADQE